MFEEFKKFALRGNVIDMAVGVIIGAAFGKIVSSLVNDIMLPVFGLLSGGIDLSTLSMTIGEATIAYGNFFQTIIDFLIISFSIFMVIKQMNRLKKKQEEGAKEAPPPPRNEQLLEEIRDLLRK